MKAKLFITSLLIAFFITSNQNQVFAQEKKSIPFVSFPEDPLNTRIYKLDNGLTVYLSVYKNAPRIQTYIAVKAGSKNDPHDATGLAHYLEHMLFKGTDQYGTKDWAKEKPELDKIEALYEKHRTTADPIQRKSIYHEIDSISGVAAKYAIANEYDKMLSSIGAKGTNAYTWVEQTVYVNDIPSNQLKKWISIEAERYRYPVMRLFHTELEAVYEEKNRNLDSDDTKAWEALFFELFHKHSYGTQTTIGTIQDLKNPSIKKIKEYLGSYYVPNNMAICLSGDIDPDQTIQWINASFGSLKSKAVPVFTPPVEDSILKPRIKTVVGPDAESMMLAWRFEGAGSHQADMITLIDMILCNGKAGLIDLNLNQKQLVLNAQSFTQIFKDYSTHILAANPREGQKMEDCRDMLLSQIGLIKKGKFPDWLMGAVITDLKLRKTRDYQSNSNRASAYVDAFVSGIEWKDYMSQIDRLSKITKQEVIDFVNKNYRDNYVIIYKKTGEDKDVKKVEKPAITPVAVNREDQSPFLKNLVVQKAEEIKPVFINYQNDILSKALTSGIPVNYNMNKENNLFSLYYIVEMGTNNDPKMGVAINYLPYLGTSRYSPAALQEEFYKLGCSFNVFNSEDQIYVSLSGLSENFDKSLKLFENLLKDAQPNPEALANLVKDIRKKRSDAKLSKDVILWDAMSAYAKYGPKNPFTNILSEGELNALKPEELINMIKGITSYEHHILYYGPMGLDLLTTELNQVHITPPLKPVPAEKFFAEKDTKDSSVYVVNYDMKQAEIMMYSKGGIYDKTMTPEMRLYNEYFGGGMSSIVFQDMRESKALAYSVFSGYNTPAKKDKSYYNMAYIGTQADKLPEAMKGMFSLLNEMPQSEKMFDAAKEAITKKIETERITRSDILFSYERAKKLGLDYDIRSDVYSKVPTMTMQQVKDFQKKYVKGKPYTIMVMGDNKALDMKTLTQYGKVKTLTLEDLFGY